MFCVIYPECLFMHYLKVNCLLKFLRDYYLIYQVLETHLKICKRLSGSISTLQTNKHWKIGKCFHHLKFYQGLPLPTRLIIWWQTQQAVHSLLNISRNYCFSKYPNVKSLGHFIIRSFYYFIFREIFRVLYPNPSSVSDPDEMIMN